MSVPYASASIASPTTLPIAGCHAPVAGGAAQNVIHINTAGAHEIVPPRVAALRKG